MSETNNNPNTVPKYKKAVIASLAAIGLGGLVAGGHEVVNAIQDHQEQVQLEQNLQRPDALEEYIKGDQLPHDKVVRLEAPADMPADTFAKEIKKDNGAQWELTQQIKPQADFHLDPGLQGGEQVVVEKSLVDSSAVKEFGVEDLSDPNRQDPATGTELPQPVVPDENGFNPNTPR